jgi:integrase
MPSLTITTRQTTSGPRYVVRYRLGGRAYPIVHGGSFRTMKAAKARRDFIGGEIAAGRNPADALRAMVSKVEQPTLTIEVWSEKFIASRIDVDANTIRSYKTALKKVCQTFGDWDSNAITVDDVAGWVSDLAATYKPGTIQLYLLTFRMLIDYIGIDPNPARDPRVKLPKRVREEPTPPPAEHVLAILEAIHDPLRRLLFVTLEQGALRLGEAVSLRWGDVDRAGLRLRLPRSATKLDQARWIYLPEWLLDAIEDTCPLEDRTPDRKVFQSVTEASAYQTMLRACKAAGVPHYHPHDLRHRRITVWHQSGVPARELAERAGHARPSMSLDVYSHVMPADEVPADRFQSLLTERR